MARAYGGFNTPDDLAAHPLVREAGIPASRIMHTEGMRRDAAAGELEVLAKACGLSGLFTADLAALEALEPSLVARLDELADMISSLHAKVDRLEGG